MSKLRDPLDDAQWTSLQRWADGVNVRRVAGFLGDLGDRMLRGDASYSARFGAARRALASAEPMLRRAPAFHHMAIAGSERSASNRSGLILIAYLKPGSRTEDGAGLPQEIQARRSDGSILGYSFPVRIEVLEDEPIVYGLSGGDKVVGPDGVRLPTGICCFAFSQDGYNYFITNAHVLANPGEDPFTRQDRCRDPNGTCLHGRPISLESVNRMDVGLVRTSSAVVPKAVRGWSERITSREDPWLNSKLTYFYAIEDTTVWCRLDNFIPGPSRIKHDGRYLWYSDFWEFRADRVPGPGHSGAAMCRQDGNTLKFVGIVFGGVPGTTRLWVYGASDVWKVLFPPDNATS